MAKLIKNQRGDMSFLTVFVIIAVNMLLSFMLLFASTKINAMNIRNAAKMELNNVSARIYSSTFHSQREANLTSYMDDLNISASFLSTLKTDFISSLNKRIKTEHPDYTLSNIELSFSKSTGKISYTFTCDASFKIAMFGELFPSIRKNITLIGSHRAKF